MSAESPGLQSNTKSATSGAEKPADESTPFAAASQPRVGAVLGRIIARSYQLGRPAARLLLPRPIRARMVDLVSWLERLAAGPIEEAFRRRRIVLAELPPVLPKDAFNGPAVLVNNALAWGGVERQIVYTLLGLGAQSPETHGLLCVRLGVDANHDFYRSALTDFKGFVRNVVATDETACILSENLDSAQRSVIEECIGWLPPDAKQEIWQFVAEFLRLRPRLVHVWQDALSITAGLAARIAGVPQIIVSGRNVAPIHFNYHRSHMKFGYSELASCADITMLNNSEAGVRSYAGWLDLPEDRFKVLRNGIDTTTIARPEPPAVATLRAELGIPPEAPVVGSIFRLYDEKRPLLWVNAAAIVAQHRPDAHFVVFGSGPLQEQMLKLSRNAGLEHRLHLPGTIANPALGLGLLDVFLLASEFEGTPNVVLEASLMGVPVVATDAGGAAEAIQEGVTGFVVRSALAPQIAARVVRILEDPAFSAQVALSGPRFVLERFGLGRMIAETIALHHGKL